ncbi:MAG: VanZ family protein [Marmoricola sp.]
MSPLTPHSEDRPSFLPVLAYALFVGALALGPIGWLLNRFTVWIYVILLNYKRWQFLSPELIGVALNFLLFIPIGFMLSRRVGAVRAIWLALAASICIEIVQFIPALGREPSLGDIVTNTLGGMMGAAMALIRRADPILGKSSHTP